MRAENAHGSAISQPPVEWPESPAPAAASPVPAAAPPVPVAASPVPAAAAGSSSRVATGKSPATAWPTVTFADDKFPNLFDDMSDDEEDEEALSGAPPPETPRHQAVDRALPASPILQCLDPVTPGHTPGNTGGHTPGRTPSRTPGRTPGHTPGHTQIVNQVGSHCDGPAGNKRRYATQDVWYFFEENSIRQHECLLCQ